jgi:hypothetical protein
MFSVRMVSSVDPVHLARRSNVGIKATNTWKLVAEDLQSLYVALRMEVTQARRDVG